MLPVPLRRQRQWSAVVQLRVVKSLVIINILPGLKAPLAVQPTRVVGAAIGNFFHS